MPHSPDELDHIATLTLAHYTARVDDFWAGTRGHDVSQNIAALLRGTCAALAFHAARSRLWPGRAT